MFMIRWDNYKYVYYTGYSPQLFDLEADPEENCDLAARSDSDSGIRLLLKEGRDALIIGMRSEGGKQMQGQRHFRRE